MRPWPGVTFTELAQNEIDEDLERQAKKAELNGDWEKARSFLSRIKGYFGEFLLTALDYSEARLNRNDEHVELLVELQGKYPDPRLTQVKLDQFLQFLEHAELNGPPARAEVLCNSFVFQKMVEAGGIWNKPHYFRKVFEIMAEDIRDADDRLWYKLPPRSLQYRTPLGILAQKADMAEELHILESAQAEVRYGLAKATSLLRQARTPESEALRGSIKRETEVTINDFRKVWASLSASSDGHTG
ncbi:hypothetical protein HAV15_011298 [Penicillium sp. str. |nr:hypothetical protein HAV15_011298 [Penicillium sp. str. \